MSNHQKYVPCSCATTNPSSGSSVHTTRENQRRRRGETSGVFVWRKGMKRHRCPDCGCLEGQFHKLGCDMERCPFCGQQFITCDCVYVKLGLIDRARYHSRTDFLPPYTYEHGLTDTQEKRWLDMLNERGRVKYIAWPNICARCGELWPETFDVPDEQWNKYVQIDQRNSMLCRTCYEDMKRLIDSRGSRLVMIER